MKIQKNQAKKIVFVGLSGGVDSSVSALLLKQAGYEVVGVFIRTWHPDFIECNEEEERHDAMRVAAHLDIPFLTFDFESIYKKEVADYMISEYRLGNTPNPDILCNSEIKFGAFLKKALSMGADYVATGHYAQNFQISLKGKTPRFCLSKAKDPTKDQSYFLYKLNQAQLSEILFPIGHLNKKDIRIIAKRFGIPVAEKKDSQGICFLGDIDLKDFLKHYIKEKKGDVLNEKNEVVGHHQGVTFVTIGARHGFTITKKTPHDNPYYVTAKDIKQNILYVSPFKDKGFLDKNHQTIISLKECNWISEMPEEDKTYSAQIRYHGEFLDCKVIISKPSSKISKNSINDEASVIFNIPILVAKSQSVVIYQGDALIGGGVVGS